MIDRALVAAAISPLGQGELSDLVDSLQGPPRPAIRLRPSSDPSALPFATEVVPWYSQGRFVTSEARPGATAEFAAGEFYIQDAGSLLPIALLDPQPGETICDLCAAPGGKSTAILEALSESGWLLANEAVKSRSPVLTFNLARHGSVRYLQSSWDPDELARRLPAQFDAVLVDAPCSGQSLVSRGKQTSSSFAPSTIEHCAARQERILDAAQMLVRPGGRLVYSTCTFAYAENEGQVESFLSRHDGWKVKVVPPSIAAVCDGSNSGFGFRLGVRLWPHRHGCGGGYAVCLQRELKTDEVADRSRNRDVQLRAGILPADFGSWGRLSEVKVYQRGLQCFAWPDNVPAELIAQSESGPEIAFRKGNTWFPAYALAMRRDSLWLPNQRIPLNDEQSVQYLQGHPLAGAATGWGLADWRGHALGWLKGNGRQLKNHLPKAGRIVVRN